MERLANAGYIHYEVSNWAWGRHSDHGSRAPWLACRHNLLYWRNEDYLGLGPGAHSHLRTVASSGAVGERRWGNRKPVPGYVKRMRSEATVEEFHEDIDAPLAMGETMMLGLRLVREGVAFARFSALHHQSMQDVFATQLADLQVQGAAGAGRPGCAAHEHRVDDRQPGLCRIFAGLTNTERAL